MTEAKGAFAILVNKNKNKILMHLRDNKKEIYYPELWGLIGGGIEKGETPLIALKREIKEEINCKVENLKFLGTCKNGSIFAFRGEIKAKVEEIKLMEGQKVDYFSIDELGDLEVIDFIRDFILENKDRLFLSKE